jgi:hypothetical protein
MNSKLEEAHSMISLSSLSSLSSPSELSLNEAALQKASERHHAASRLRSSKNKSLNSVQERNTRKKENHLISNRKLINQLMKQTGLKTKATSVKRHHEADNQKR